MSWWADVPGEAWAIIASLFTGLGGQIALQIKWKREDKLRAEARELGYQKKIDDLHDAGIERQKEYTKGLIEYAQINAELRAAINRNNELFQDVAQVLKEFVRGRVP